MDAAQRSWRVRSWHGHVQFVISGVAMTSRTTRRILLVKGIVLLLLSAVHTVAIPFEHQRIQAQTPTRLGYEYAFWFGALGFYFAFLGVVDLLASKKLGEVGSLAWPVAFSSCLFTAVSGVAGVAMFHGGPPLVLLGSGVVGVWAMVAQRCDASRSSDAEASLAGRS
jgi:hypothetical protein